ncbi:MAG: NAD(P)H-dependent flavin oxidoreductase, partial [Acidimicrobiales bacterium]
IGLLGWSLQNNRDPLNAALEAAPALISICFGPYEAEVDAVRGAGIVFATQVGTVEEALAAERCGVDLIVVRGREGGGHGMNEVGTLALLQAVLDAVDRPVLGAGGLSGSGGLAAVLAAGAVAGWAGTAFMACPEAETAAGAKQRLFAASETDTAYGRVFDVAQRLDWPERYGGRALRNAFFDRWVGQYDALAADQAPVEELRSARQAGDFDVAPIYAGQGVGMLREERPAARVVEEFARADEKLRRALDSAS